MENQAREVEKVKRSENGVIVDPITLPPNATIAKARKIMREYNVSGIPIVEDAVGSSRSGIAASGAIRSGNAQAAQAGGDHDPARSEISGGRQSRESAR